MLVDPAFMLSQRSAATSLVDDQMHIVRLRNTAAYMLWLLMFRINCNVVELGVLICSQIDLSHVGCTKHGSSQALGRLIVAVFRR